MMDDDDKATAADAVAQSLASKGDIPAAIQYLTDAQRTLNHYGLWHNLGRLQVSAGDYEGAIDSFSRAIQHDYNPSLVSRGLAYEYLLMNAEATADYLEALRRDPGDLEALINLGTLYVEEGQLPSARELLERAAAIDPTANWQLSDVYLESADWNGAIAVADLAIAAGEPRAHLARALAREALGDDPVPDFRAAVEAGARTAESELERYLVKRDRA
ncbi:tetratricopeptide repeat protein [Salinibacterium soli]|uniref:Tetratricopeptide repeat protein n=1 Tax=Antiquaquibacter soli TaxID=3064523 RepID=A0ABT9BI62_9MICO|nr:tetratricopeptide repeat protein [Protaetiibacter sp. WY-16]MDO7880712.1 tetratricopeptide repeat protein [Protaetiibacter sp. WY-16]